MSLITKAELARACGRTPQFIDQQLKKGKATFDIVVIGQTASGKDKIKVDADSDNTIDFINYCLERGQDSQKKTDPEPVKKPEPPAESSSKSPGKKNPAKLPNHITGKTHATAVKSEESGKAGLEREKLQEGIEKLKIDNQKNRGKLIPKILIQRVFSRIYSIDENQLKQLGINISPKISAIYNESNQDKSKEILELIDKKGDKELEKEINKILNSGEPDRIQSMSRIIEDAIGIILKSIKREIDKFLKNIKKLEE